MGAEELHGWVTAGPAPAVVQCNVVDAMDVHDDKIVLLAGKGTGQRLTLCQ